MNKNTIIILLRGHCVLNLKLVCWYKYHTVAYNYYCYLHAHNYQTNIIQWVLFTNIVDKYNYNVRGMGKRTINVFILPVKY